MKIPTNVHKRLKKSCSKKEVLQNVFINEGYEYVSNSLYAVRMNEQVAQANTEGAPAMSVPYGANIIADAPSLRLSIDQLQDMLAIVKANGSSAVDISLGKIAAVFQGIANTLDRKSETITTSLLMGIIK